MNFENLEYIYYLLKEDVDRKHQSFLSSDSAFQDAEDAGVVGARLDTIKRERDEARDAYWKA